MKEMALGEKVKELRLEHNYTQKDISTFLGVDQSLISKYESGERFMNIATLEKLSELFCCDLVSLESTSNTKICVAFRTQNISTMEMKTIQTVNRIVLNSIFMADLIEVD